MMKKCGKCSEEKEFSDFYKSKTGKNGLESQCKKCKAAYHKKNSKRFSLRKKAKYYSDPEYREKVLSARKEYRAKNIEKVRSQCREWHRKNKRRDQRAVAREAVAYALRRGKIERSACNACGCDERVEAHHSDYSRPLDIEWLCKKCHYELHKQVKTLKFNLLTKI